MCQLCQIDITEIIGDFTTINSLQTSEIFMADQSSPLGTGVPGGIPPATNPSTTQLPVTPSTDAQGRRVRLRPKPGAVNGQTNIYGGSGLLQPLRATNGVVWPYQPTITWETQVDYSSIDMVHVNQEILSYTKTPAAKFNISGDFSVQNNQEGLYALAAIHFMRTMTKMYFGTGQALGTPPPVLLFDAYGEYMFNQLPVVITQFSVGLPNDVDYVPINTAYVQTYTDSQSQTNMPGFSKIQSTPQLSSQQASFDAQFISSALFQSSLTGEGGYIWLPSVFNLSVSLTVQNTATRLRAFNLDSFRTGKLMTEGRWI
jgi:hypothetical protein